MEGTGIFNTDTKGDIGQGHFTNSKYSPNSYAKETPHLRESSGLNSGHILLTKDMFREQMFTKLSEVQRPIKKKEHTTEDGSEKLESEHDLKFVKTENGSMQCLRCKCLLIAGGNSEDHLVICERLNSCDNSSSDDNMKSPDFDIGMLQDSEDSSTEEEDETRRENQAVCRIFECSLCKQIFQCKSAYLDHKNCCQNGILVSNLAMQRQEYGNQQERYSKEILAKKIALKNIGIYRKRDRDLGETPSDELTTEDMNKEADEEIQKTKRQKQEGSTDIYQEVVKKDGKKERKNSADIEPVSETDPSKINSVGRKSENRKEVTKVWRNGIEMDKEMNEVIVISEASDSEKDIDDDDNTCILETSNNGLTKSNFVMKAYSDSKNACVSKGRLNDGSYRCANCEETFLTYVLLKIHHLLEHRELIPSRPKQKIPSEVAVQKPLTKNSQDELNICGKNEKADQLTSRNMLEANSCEDGRYAAYKLETIRHEANAAASKCESTKAFWCFFRKCGKHFKTEKRLKKHIRWEISIHNNHVGEAYEQKLSPKEIQSNLKQLGFTETISSCEHKGCGYLCTKTSQIMQHYLEVHSKSGFVCDRRDCLRRFDTRFKLRSHIIVDHPTKSAESLTPELKQLAELMQMEHNLKLKETPKQKIPSGVAVQKPLTKKHQDELNISIYGKNKKADRLNSRKMLETNSCEDSRYAVNKNESIRYEANAAASKCESTEAFWCFFRKCGKHFKTKKRLKKHIRWEISIHNNHVGEAYEQKLSPKEIQSNLKQLGFTETISNCEHKGCGYLCTTTSQIMQHSLEVHSKSGFVCDRKDCLRRFDTRFKLKSHIIVDHPTKSAESLTPELKQLAEFMQMEHNLKLKET